jgi:hypothetical protein
VSSDVAPSLIGFAAAGLLLTVIGVTLGARRLLDRARLRRRSRGPKPEGWETSQDWVYRPRASGHPGTDASRANTYSGTDGSDSGVARDVVAPTAQTPAPPGDDSPEAEQRATRTVEHARRLARRLIEETQLELREMATAAEREREDLRRRCEAEAKEEADAVVEEARRRAAEIQESAELQANRMAAASAQAHLDELRRETLAEVEQQAAAIVEAAQKRAEEVGQDAARDAQEIVATAERERARLLDELAHERAVAAETRRRFSSFLHDVLDEVETDPRHDLDATTSLSSPSAARLRIRAVSEAHGMTSSAGADE